MTFEYDFAAAGPQGWVAGSSDYPVSFEPAMDLQSGIRTLPPALSGTGLYLTGRNNSDDLFLYIKRRITGLTPNGNYRLSFRLTFATRSNAFNEMVLKAGATTIEPHRIAVQVPPGSPSDPYWVMNIDKGIQGTGGKDAVVVGTNMKPHPGDLSWELQTVQALDVFTVRADENGAVWVIIGGECTFEVLNEIYYTTVGIDARPEPG